MSSIFSTDETGNAQNGAFTQYSGSFDIPATAYSLDLGKSTVPSSAFIDIDPLENERKEDIVTNLDANLWEGSSFLATHFSKSDFSQSAVEKNLQRSFNTDELTGLYNEKTVLNTNSTSSESQTFVGKLEWGDDYYNPTRPSTLKDDYWLLEQAPKNVQIDLSSSNFDTYLQLVDANTGALLADNDDGPNDNAQVRNSQLNFTAQAGKKYLIRVTSYSAWTLGDYSLTVVTDDAADEPSRPHTFSSTYGYGMIDAAAAVATAVGKTRFDDVADIGGNQWNNDMVYAPEAWAQGYTGEGVTVAVIDSGVDINHQDLRSNIWENTDDILGDGIDNDNNGYTDDRYGWNFGIGQNNNDILPGTFSLAQDHGTHVAGTIAAASNGIGMTGVAYNSKIMALRLGDVASDGIFTNGGDLSQAIRYAVDNGADVINMSVGWDDPTGSVRESLAYAASRNVIAVMSAGNSGDSSPRIPASYATDYGISVGSVARDGKISYFSNEAGTDSRMHHVMAPGENIYSTGFFDRWWSKDGTSMAAPHVAGVVALMLGANPNLTHAQVRSVLTGVSTLTTASADNSSLLSSAASVAELETLEAGLSAEHSGTWDSFRASALLPELETTATSDLTAQNSQMPKAVHSETVYSDDWQFQLPQPLPDATLDPVAA